MVRKRSSKRERVSARKRAETHKTGFDSTSLNIPKDAKLFRLDKAGTRRIDIIPYRAGEGNPYAEEGDLWYERTFFVHRNVGPNQEQYVCPAKTAGKPCPICEHRAKLAKNPDTDEDAIKELAPKERQVFNVIDVEKPDDGVQLWDISFYLFGKLLDTEVRNADEDEDYEYFSDLEDGYTLKLGVEEQSFGGRTFCSVETIGFKARRESYDEDILEQSHCLDEVIQILPYEKLKSIFLQVPSDDEDEDEDEKPAKKKVSKKASKTKSAEDLGIEEGSKVEHDEFGTCGVLRVGKDGTKLMLEDEDGDIQKNVPVSNVKLLDDDDEEPEEDDDDWDEEEEEKPKKKPKKKPVKKSSKKAATKKKTSKKKEEEPEEDEDDWEDDWDEEEKPKKKPVKKKSKKTDKEEDDDDDWD